MTEFAAQQPAEGDVILYCAHSVLVDLDSVTFKEGTHWYSAEAPFTAPSGEEGVARWFVVCDACHRSLEGDPRRLARVPVVGHCTWRGSRPIIGEPARH